MPNAPHIPFEDEAPTGDDGAIDAVILAAGGDQRAAIRALLVDLAEAQAALREGASLGYLRRRQPARRLP